MIIDLIKLRSRGKESEDFTFTYTPEDNLSDLPDAVFTAPVTVEAHVEVYPDEVYINGSVRFEVSASCSRCLKPTVFCKVVEFDERFLPLSRANEADDCNVYYKNERIDLTGFVKELIVLNMPLTVLCDENCKGLCPVCGQDLNNGDCGHRSE